MNHPPLKICIDARLPDATVGGAAKVVVALATAFSKLADGNEEYHFLTLAEANDWIRPYLQGPCHLFPGPVSGKNTIKKRLGRILWLRKAWHRISYPLWPWLFKFDVSDGTIERAGFNLMHFTMQDAFLTSIPTIYQPHDLQHLYYPQFFTRRDLFRREKIYRTFSERASMVVAMSQWGRDDLIKHFQLAPDKVRVIPWGPWTDAPTPSPEEMRRTRDKFQLPDSFIFLPGQTWAHKNHIAALRALKMIQRDQGLQIPLVCSGQKNEFYPKIEQCVRELDLGRQVKFLGFVNEVELACLYRLAKGLLFPTKFEGWGLPVSEAFHVGLPVACSNVTCLPAQAGDAALIFDPDNISEIATAVHRLWTDETLRADLIEKGKKRAAQFSWDHTARLFRAHYRRIANRPLNDEDRWLLSQPPLV